MVGVVFVQAGDDLHGDVRLAGAGGAHHHGQPGVQARPNRLHLRGRETHLEEGGEERGGGMVNQGTRVVSTGGMEWEKGGGV